MHIGIYSRKSIYSDKSDSVETQIKICEEYADSHYDNIETVVRYNQDEGYSGSNTDRPGFKLLMSNVVERKIDVLICYKIDRISRNVLDFSKTFELLQENHVEFVSVKEQIDTSTPLGRAMMYICSVFAQMERETIAERVKDNMIELSKSGKWAGGKPPLGYMLERVVINGKKHSILAINKEEMPLLNLVYDTFLKGYSLNGMETYFKKMNVKSKNGDFFSSTQLHQILKNPHYAVADESVYNFFLDKGCVMGAEKEKFDGKYGLVVYGRTSGGRKKTHSVNTADKWIVSVGKHKAIMSSDKWLSVQYRFGHNVIDKTRKHQIGLLKGIIRCKCGNALRTKRKVDKIYHKVYDDYFCPNRDRKGIEYCDMKMISISDVDCALIEKLKAIKADKSLLYKYISKYAETPTFRNKEAILRDIAKVKKKIVNLTNAIQEDAASSAVKYMVSQIESLDNEIVCYNFELRELEISIKEKASITNDADKTYYEICDFLDTFEDSSYDAKINHLKRIIKDCVWDGNQLIVTF